LSIENPQPLSINSMAALVTLGKFLEEDQWFPQLLENKRIYRVTYSGKNGQFVCFAQIMNKTSIIMCMEETYESKVQW